MVFCGEFAPSTQNSHRYPTAGQARLLADGPGTSCFAVDSRHQEKTPISLIRLENIFLDENTPFLMPPGQRQAVVILIDVHPSLAPLGFRASSSAGYTLACRPDASRPRCKSPLRRRPDMLPNMVFTTQNPTLLPVNLK